MTRPSLIEEGTAAVAEYNAIRKAWRARKHLVLVAARGLLEARRQFPDDRDFRRWLRRSAYRNMRKQDRAALLHIGEHEKALAAVLKGRSLGSPASIWQQARAAIGARG